MASPDRLQPRGREVPLNRRRIFEAALELVDREGADALTMRRVANELGVAAMSLYNHVQGREEILDGLSEVMVSEIDLGGPSGSPRAVLERFMGGIRRVALAHPEAFRSVGMRPLRTPEAFRSVEAALGALRAIGLGQEEAAYAYRALVAYARGFALAEISGMTLEVSPEAPDDGWPDELDREAYPHIVELAARLARPDHDAAFAFGAEAILKALESRAASRAGAPP